MRLMCALSSYTEPLADLAGLESARKISISFSNLLFFVRKLIIYDDEQPIHLSKLLIWEDVVCVWDRCAPTSVGENRIIAWRTWEYMYLFWDHFRFFVCVQNNVWALRESTFDLDFITRKFFFLLIMNLWFYLSWLFFGSNYFRKINPGGISNLFWQYLYALAFCQTFVQIAFLTLELWDGTAHPHLPCSNIWNFGSFITIHFFLPQSYLFNLHFILSTQLCHVSGELLYKIRYRNLRILALVLF